MSIYYDTALTPTTQLSYKKPNDTRYPSDDARVANWYSPLPSDEWVRQYDSEGFPFVMMIPDDPYWDTSTEELRAMRYGENDTAARDMIEVAERTPRKDTNLDDKGLRRENDRRDNRAKGKDKLSDDDDHLSDYIDTVMDGLDNADGALENMERVDLESYVAADYPYPVWAPLP